MPKVHGVIKSTQFSWYNEYVKNVRLVLKQIKSVKKKQNKFSFILEEQVTNRFYISRHIFIWMIVV